MGLAYRTTGLLLAASAAVTAACDLGPLAPSSSGSAKTYYATGIVRDDECLSSGAPCNPIAGVLLTAVPKGRAGVSAVTEADGTFRLGPLLVEGQTCVIIAGCTQKTTTVRVSKDEWEPVTAGISSNYPSRTVTMGREPHVLWGKVTAFPAGNAIAGALVEIAGGANDGRTALTNASGIYRFDDMKTSSNFELHVSAAGFISRTNPRTDLTLSEVISMTLWPLS